MSPTGKYLDPKNDFLFKRLFGTEKNKPLLLHFLNDIFHGYCDPIQDVTFINPIFNPQ